MKKKSRERFQNILRVFIKYGFGYLADSKLSSHKKSPENLRKAFEELGPTFIKIGQILSTRSDILSKEYIDELVKLQDSAQEIEFVDIKKVFEESLNKSISDYFLYFDENAMASGSIAQVHSAILKDGSSVIVKIQRPEIKEEMKMDISILRRIINFTKLKITLTVIDPIDLLNELEESTENELDFIKEGKNILRFKENNKSVKCVYAPCVIKEIWSDKVLTLENIYGFKINDLQMIINEGYDNKDIGKKLALSYCKQIFDDGFFHADPHPGNILISNGKICFIDFGIVGELDEVLKSWLNDVMLAVAIGDKNKIVDFILAVGIKIGKVNREELYGDVSYLFDTYISTSLKNIKASIVLTEVFNVAKNNKIQFPRDLVVLIRGLVILEGVVSEVDPNLNIISVVTSFVKTRSDFSLVRELEGEQLLISAYRFTRDSMRLPSKLLDVCNNIANGKTKLNLTVNELDKTILILNSMINRIVLTILISALILGSSLIVSSSVGPLYGNISIIGIIGYIISGVLFIILLISIFKSRECRVKKGK